MIINGSGSESAIAEFRASARMASTPLPTREPHCRDAAHGDGPHLGLTIGPTVGIPLGKLPPSYADPAATGSETRDREGFQRRT